jgi:hypothetical protein
LSESNVNYFNGFPPTTVVGAAIATSLEQIDLHTYLETVQSLQAVVGLFMQVLRLLLEVRLGRCCHRHQSRVHSHVHLLGGPRLHVEALCQGSTAMVLGEGEQGLDGSDQAGGALHRHVVVRMRSMKIGWMRLSCEKIVFDTL